MTEKITLSGATNNQNLYTINGSKNVHYFAKDAILKVLTKIQNAY